MIKLRQPLTESQARLLIAHLGDYIQLMELIWPDKEDAVKTRAKTLYWELTGKRAI